MQGNARRSDYGSVKRCALGCLWVGMLLTLSGCRPPVAERPPPEPELPTFAPLPYGDPQKLTAAAQREAEQVAQAVVREFPEQPAAYEIAGRVAWRAADHERAVAAWRRALQLHPGFAPAHYGLVDAAWSRGDYEDVARQLERLLARYPDDQRARQMLAQALLESGQFEEVVKRLADRLKGGQGTAIEHQLLAAAYSGLEDQQQAEQHYRAALRLEPNSETALYGLAMLCRRRGEREEAEEYLARLEAIRAQQGTAGADQEGMLEDSRHMVEHLAEVHAGAAALYAADGDLPRTRLHQRRRDQLAPGRSHH